MKTKDTIQAVYSRDYKPLGIKKREVASHSGMTIAVILGMVLSAPVILPLIKGFSLAFGPFQGIVFLGIVFGGAYYVFRLVDREDPIEVHKRHEKKREELRAHLIEEIKSGKYLN